MLSTSHVSDEKNTPDNSKFLKWHSQIQTFCDETYLKYRKFRSGLNLYFDSYPAYELAKLYYELATLWFYCYDEQQNAINIVANYLNKSLLVFGTDCDPTIDIVEKAKRSLTFIQKTIHDKKQEVKKLNKEMQSWKRLVEDQIGSNNIRDDLIKNLLKLAENHLVLGSFKAGEEYLDCFEKMLEDDKECARLKISKEIVQNHKNYFEELKIRLNFAKTIETLLKLEENLMFIEDDNNTQVDLIYKEDFRQMRNILKDWKKECTTMFQSSCILRLLDRNFIKTYKDKVLENKEVLIFEKNAGYFISCGNSFDSSKLIRIEDKQLINLLKVKVFDNRAVFDVDLIEQVNAILIKKRPDFIINKNTKNKILILRNKEDLSFYIYAFLIDCQRDCKTPDRQIWGDMISPYQTNTDTKKLWQLLNKTFAGKGTISKKELIQILLNPELKLFRGVLRKNLPLQKTEKFVESYKRLSHVYRQLGNLPLAKQYDKLSMPKPIEASAQSKTKSAKNALINQQIISEKGFSFPGEKHLNKPIEPEEFFSLVLPRLSSIDGLQKGFNPCAKIVFYYAAGKPNNEDWFKDNNYSSLYKKEQEEAQMHFGKLIHVCLIFYFNQETALENQWGIMFELDQGKKLCGLPAKLNAVNPAFKDITCRLISLKANIDFGKGLQCVNHFNFKLLPKTDRFKNNAAKIESVFNNFLQENYLIINKAYEDFILLNQQISLNQNYSEDPKLYDVTSIEGAIELKMAIKAAREGCFLLLRKINNSVLSTNLLDPQKIIEKNDNYEKIPQILYIPSQTQLNHQQEEVSGRYFIHACSVKNGHKVVWELKEVNDRSALDLLERLAFKYIIAGNEKRLFISSLENAYLYNIIEEAFSGNSNRFTKTEKEDTFYALLKVSEFPTHYITLGITRSLEKCSYNRQDYIIYLIDPSGKSSQVDYLKFLALTGNDYQYQFTADSYIKSPIQYQLSEDSLIHAHFNLKALQWAWKDGKDRWQFFLGYFKYQLLSNAKNIERVKKWFINIEKILVEEKTQIKDKSLINANITNFSASLYELNIDEYKFLSKEIEPSLEQDNLTITILQLNNILIQFAKAMQMVNKVQKPKFENLLFHKLIMSLETKTIILQKNQGLIFNDENLSIIILLDKLKTILSTEITAYNQLAYNLINKLNSFFDLINKIPSEKPNVNNNIFEQLKQVLSDMFWFERHQIVSEIVEQANSLVDKELEQVFVEALQSKFESKQPLNLDFINNLAKLTTSKQFNNIDPFIELIMILNRKSSIEELKNAMVETWLKSNSLVDVQNDEILCSKLKNYYKQLNDKITRFLFLFPLVEKFIHQFVQELFNKYGDQNLQDIYTSTYQAIESSFTAYMGSKQNLNNYPDGMPAQAEAKEVLAKGAEAGSILVNSAALAAVRMFPSYIAKYRMSCCENFEQFYDILHQLLLKDLETLNLQSELFICDNLPDFIQTNCRHIFIKPGHTDYYHKTKYAVKFYSAKEKRVIESEFTRDKIASIGQGIIKLEEKIKQEILQSINYFDHNDCIIGYKVNSFGTECASLLKSDKNKKVSVLQRLVEIVTMEQKGYIIKAVNEFPENCQAKVIYLQYNRNVIRYQFYNPNNIKIEVGTLPNNNEFSLYKKDLEDLKNPGSFSTPQYYSAEFESFILSKIQYRQFFHDAVCETHPSILQLVELLPKMDQDYCSTKQYLDEYYPMIQGLVESFAKVIQILPKIRQSLWQALVTHYDSVENQEINECLQKQILDKINAQTEIDEILDNLEGIKLDKATTEELKSLQSSFDKRNDSKGKYACAAFLRQYIIDLVAKYVDSLMSFREDSIEMFDEVEKIVHQTLSSFSLLSSNDYLGLKDIFERYIKEIEAIKQPITIDRKNLYQDIYKKTINYIPKKSLSISQNQSLQRLTSSFNNLDHSHIIYIKLRIENLKKMLNNFIKPHNIIVEENQRENRIKVIVQVSSTILSRLLDEVERAIGKKFQPGDELRIIVADKFYLDVDLQDEHYSGVNIILVGLAFELPSGKSNFTIKTDGLDGKPFEQAKAGENGGQDRHGYGKDGRKGEDGLTGLPGGHAGNIYIITDKFIEPEKVSFSACGGNGGPGQVGGNGGDGGNGKDGANGTKTQAKNNLFNLRTEEHFVSRNISGIAWDLGSEGKSGGNGGNSGYSGYGGNKGKSGTINIVSMGDRKTYLKLEKKDGKEGDAGNFEIAKVGKAGIYGSNGNTIIYIANQVSEANNGTVKGSENFLEIKCYDYSIINRYRGFNGELNREHIIKDESQGYFYKHYLGSDDVKPYFKSYEAEKEFNNQKLKKEANNGRQIKELKDTNRQMAKKINSIDINQVYKDSKQFLESICQTNSEHYQAWQAKKIAKFLNDLSAHIGKNDYYDVPDLDRDVQQTSVIHTQLINTINAALQRLRVEESEVKKSREQQLLTIGLNKISLQVSSELQKIKQNEHLWKATQQNVTKKERELEVLIDKNHEMIKRVHQIDNLRLPKELKKSEETIEKYIIIKSLNKINKSILNGNAGKVFERISELIHKVKGSNELICESVFLGYKNENFIYCLDKIRNDKNFLERNNLIANDVIAKPTDRLITYFMSKYIAYRDPEKSAQQFLDVQGINNNETSLIGAFFSKINFKEPQSLVHSIYLIDCLDLLKNVLSDTSNFKMREKRRILSWLNAFFNLSKVCKEIKTFSGYCYDLQKVILKNLFRDTIQHCFPKLKEAYKKVLEGTLLDNIQIDLLSIFYNRLQYEYQDDNQQLLNDNAQVNFYRSLSSENFYNLLKVLADKETSDKQIIDDFNLTKTLAAASLFSWPNIIAEIKLSIRFSELLNKSNINLASTKNIKACLRLFNYFRQSLSEDQFNQLFPDSIEEGSTIKEPLDPLFNLLLSLQNQKITFENVCTIKKSSYLTWISKIKEVESQKAFYQEPRQRDINGLIEALKKQNDKNISEKKLIKLKTKLEEIDKLIKSQKEALDENSTDQKNIIKARLSDPQIFCSDKQKNLCEKVAIIACAWYVENKQIPKATQIAALLLILDANLRNENLLTQINTGEGKTLTVALISAYLALHGYYVDVISSNRDLAIDGEKKSAGFFQLLSLSSNHNCHSEEEDRKKTYQNNIIYGEVAAYQGDILESEFNKKDVVGSRYHDMNKVCLIVDEVDSMCLDKAKDVLYLSHNIDGLKWLETVFVYVWIAVLKEAPESEADLSKNAEKVSKGIMESIKSKDIFVPEHLKSYVNSKIKIWVENAFQAKGMNVNNEFVIDKYSQGSETDVQKRIIVLDKDVGVEQYSSRWSNGLAQFLELKFRRKLSVESLKAVFMSNKKFFERYGEQLYGLTGTLGSDASKQFLKDVYKTRYVVMPTAYPKQYYMETPAIGLTVKEWINAIIRSVKEHSHRPVLIITDTVQNSEFIIDHLKSEGISQSKIRPYIRDCDEVERYFQANPATGGDIIVATNKGGRGTDIKVSETSNKKHGGMHVILSYLPNNDRIEEQAFGRTSRNGNPGSGQFILLVEEDDELKNELANLNQEERIEYLTNLAPAILQKNKDNRNKEAESLLDNMMKTGILHLDIEQRLFDEFRSISRKINGNLQKLINQYIEKLSDNEGDKETPAVIAQDGYESIEAYGLLGEAFSEIGGYERFQEYGKTKFYDEINKHLVRSIFKKEIEEFVINIIKDKWAFWLDSVQPVVNKAKSINVQSILLEKMKKEFDTIVKETEGIGKKIDITNLLSITQFPEQQIKLGELLLRHGKKYYAKKCFEKAKMSDPLGVAYLGLAYCSIPSQGGERGKDFEIKKIVRNNLKHARFKIEAMQRTLSINKLLGDKLVEMTKDMQSINQFVSNQDNFYCKQLESKLQIFETHVRVINKAIGSSIENEYVFAEGNEKEFEKSKGIYFKFVNSGILHHNRVRREYITEKKKLSDAARTIIQANFDKSISESVINFLNDNIDKSYIQLKAFQRVARDKFEFWELLKKCSSSKVSEKVDVLDIQKAYQQLPEEHKSILDELTGNFSVGLITLDNLIQDPMALYGENIKLIWLRSNNSIYLYGKLMANKWGYTKLINGWNLERCDKLPENETIKSNLNKLYYRTIESCFSYAYFSNKLNKVVHNVYNSEQSKEFYCLLETLDQSSSLETILHYTLGQLEEPLYRLPFSEGIDIRCSLQTDNEEIQWLYNVIKKSNGHWIEFLDPYNVQNNLFDTNKKRELEAFLKKSQLITAQERILIIDQFSFIRNLGKSINDKPKYKDIAFANSNKGIIGYFQELFENKKMLNTGPVSEYLYLSEVPFETKEIESESIIKILHDLKILKSGGLHLQGDKQCEPNETKYAYENFKEFIEDKSPSEGKPFVDNIVALQGDIRSYRDGLKGWLKQFTEITSKDLGSQGTISVPEELPFYSTIGFHRVLVLEEYKRFHMNWAAFFVLTLGVLQVVFGAALCSIGVVNFGKALISEGISDMIQGTMGMITGNFNLVDWAKSKAISFAISMLTAGIQTMKSAANVAKDVKNAYGTLTKGQIFFKSISTACAEFVMQLGGELISHYAIGELTSMTHDLILKGLTPVIKEKLDLKVVKEKLKEIRKQKGNIAYKEALNEFKTAIVSVLKNKEISEKITELNKLVHHCVAIKNAFKEQKATEGGNWKQRLAKQAVNQGIKFAIDTAINGLKTAEIPKVMVAVNNAVENTISAFDRKLQKEETIQNSTKEEEKQIEQELDNLIMQVSNRITNDIVGFISGAATGALKMGVSVGTMAVTEKIEIALDKKFERKNEITRRNAECRETQKTRIINKGSNNEKGVQQSEHIENGVVSPKCTLEESANEHNNLDKYQTETKDKERKLNLADAQMQANKENRNIYVRDFETGEVIKIKPDNFGSKFAAFFRDDAAVDFKNSHFTAGVGQERYKETDGKQNCFLIAYHESLGKEVNNEFIMQRRHSLHNYERNNQEEYIEARKDMTASRHRHVVGGIPILNVELNSSEIRFSQSNIGNQTRVGVPIDALAVIMHRDGFIYSTSTDDPMMIVQMPDGQYTSLDNRRLAAAQSAGVNIKADVYGYNEELPTNQQKRFSARTAGEAVQKRMVGEITREDGTTYRRGSLPVTDYGFRANQVRIRTEFPVLGFRNFIQSPNSRQDEDGRPKCNFPASSMKFN